MDDYHMGETLVCSCKKHECTYNSNGFCRLNEIILDESGQCIYKDNADKTI